MKIAQNCKRKKCFFAFKADFRGFSFAILQYEGWKYLMGELKYELHITKRNIYFFLCREASMLRNAQGRQRQ